MLILFHYPDKGNKEGSVSALTLILVLSLTKQTNKTNTKTSRHQEKLCTLKRIKRSFTNNLLTLIKGCHTPLSHLPNKKLTIKTTTTNKLRQYL